ncbi:MAG: radical SAM protein [Bacteroides sp.]|nr:radical SAM protein [Bacteroides sp.]
MHYKFRYEYLFDGVPRPDFQKLSGNLALYGAGFQGLLAAHLLKKQGVEILCFGDRDVRKQGTLYYGIPVVSPEEMKEKYPEAAVMATPYGLSSVWDYIKNELKYKNVITPFSLFLEFDSDEFDKLPELPFWYHSETLDLNIEMFLIRCAMIETDRCFFSTDLSVTEKCNLKCRNCTSLMPCYDNPRDFSYEEVLEDISTLIKDKIFYRIWIEGGEPFLWEPLYKLLNALSEQEEIMNIAVVTNGTVMPDSRLLKSLQNPKVQVRVSDYGNQSKLKKLVDTLTDNGIYVRVQLQKWYKLADLSKEPKTGEDLKEIIESCTKLQPECSFYTKNGKLFKCPLQGNLHELGLFPSDPNEYVDLRDKNDLDIHRKITDYFTKPNVPKICAHCNGRGYTGVEVPPAEQLQKGERLTVRFE